MIELVKFVLGTLTDDIKTEDGDMLVDEEWVETFWMLVADEFSDELYAAEDDAL